jgi:hypothetical protein
LAAVVIVVGVSGCGGLTSTIEDGGNGGGGTGSGNLRVLPYQSVRATVSGTGEVVVWPQTLLAEGGSPLSGYTWTVAPGNTLPVGTNVNVLTGVFWGSGAGLTPGTYPFTMQVSDASTTATGTITLVVEQHGDIVPFPEFQQRIDTAEIPLMDARAGHPYGASLYVLGGQPPYSWAEDTSYPGRTDFDLSGLTIDATRGVVRGTPMSSAAGKTLRFRVVVHDSAGDTAIGEPVYTIAVQ